MLGPHRKTGKLSLLRKRLCTLCIIILITAPKKTEGHAARRHRGKMPPRAQRRSREKAGCSFPCKGLRPLSLSSHRATSSQIFRMIGVRIDILNLRLLQHLVAVGARCEVRYSIQVEPTRFDTGTRIRYVEIGATRELLHLVKVDYAVVDAFDESFVSRRLPQRPVCMHGVMPRRAVLLHHRRRRLTWRQ